MSRSIGKPTVKVEKTELDELRDEYDRIAVLTKKLRGLGKNSSDPEIAVLMMERHKIGNKILYREKRNIKKITKISYTKEERGSRIAELEEEKKKYKKEISELRLKLKKLRSETVDEDSEQFENVRMRLEHVTNERNKITIRLCYQKTALRKEST